MPNIGPLEIVIVLIIALIVFGPKRLPELGHSMGKGLREFRGSLSGDGGESEEKKAHELEGAPAKAEAVEGEVVTKHRA